MEFISKLVTFSAFLATVLTNERNRINCPNVYEAALRSGPMENLMKLNGKWLHLKRSFEPDSLVGECGEDRFFVTETESRGIIMSRNTTTFNGQRFRSEFAFGAQQMDFIGEPWPLFVLEETGYNPNPRDAPNFFVLYLDQDVALTYFCEITGLYKRSIDIRLLSRDLFPSPSCVRTAEEILRSIDEDALVESVDQHCIKPDPFSLVTFLVTSAILVFVVLVVMLIVLCDHLFSR